MNLEALSLSQLRPIDVSHLAPATLADQPAPILDWIAIEKMVIDDRYQRPLQRSNLITIQKIAADFRWARFTPVLLAPIEGGKYAVIDGQHRVHAAALCGITHVPAMVVMIHAAEQAQAFIQVNTARVNVSVFHVFRAALTAGDVWAIEARDAVAKAGCTLMTYHPSASKKKPGEIYVIGLIRDMIRKGQAEAITTTLLGIRLFDSSPGASSVPLYSDLLLNPLFAVVAKLPGLSPDVLAGALRRRRPMLVIDAAERFAKANPGEKRLTIIQNAFAMLIRDEIAARAEVAA